MFFFLSACGIPFLRVFMYLLLTHFSWLFVFFVANQLGCCFSWLCWVLVTADRSLSILAPVLSQLPAWRRKSHSVKKRLTTLIVYTLHSKTLADHMASFLTVVSIAYSRRYNRLNNWNLSWKIKKRSTTFVMCTLLSATLADTMISSVTVVLLLSPEGAEVE